MRPISGILAVAALATLAVLTLAGCTREAMSDPPPERSEGYVQSSNDVELFYRVEGTGRDTIVVLHGGPGLSFDYLAPDLEPLAHAFTIIHYDQRGGGRSTLISDSAYIHMVAHVDDLEHVRRHFGIDRLNLLGHSWGAGVAAQYARTYPERVGRLILAASTAPRDVPHMEVFRQNRRARMGEARVARLAEIAAARDTAADVHGLCRESWAINLHGMIQDPAAVSRVRGDYCTPSAEALVNQRLVNAFTMRSIRGWDWRDDFGEVQSPVLVIHGADDPMPIATAHEWADAFPNSRLVVIENASHNPHVEQPDVFFGAVQEFMGGGAGASWRGAQRR